MGWCPLLESLLIRDSLKCGLSIGSKSKNGGNCWRLREYRSNRNSMHEEQRRSFFRDTTLQREAFKVYWAERQLGWMTDTNLTAQPMSDPSLLFLLQTVLSLESLKPPADTQSSCPRGQAGRWSPTNTSPPHTIQRKSTRVVSAQCFSLDIFSFFFWRPSHTAVTIMPKPDFTSRPKKGWAHGFHMDCDERRGGELLAAWQLTPP